MAQRPVDLRSWSMLTDLNGLGEAVFTICVGHSVLLVCVNPRSKPAAVMRVQKLTGSGGLPWADALPFAVLDLIETVVSEHFPKHHRISPR